MRAHSPRDRGHVTLTGPLLLSHWRPPMTTTPKTTAHDRAGADLRQLRLFAQVEAALTAAPDRLPAPAPDPVRVGPAREQDGPTSEVLALSFLHNQARLQLARLAFGRDHDTKARTWAALQAARRAHASLARTRTQLEAALQCGDTASAARLTVMGRMLEQAAAATQARLERFSELHRLRARGGPPWVQYLDRLAREQDIIDRADASAQTARRALLSRLAADRPTWLPALAVDATGTARDRWDQQSVQVATYRARYGVTDHTHPLGARPIDLDQASEYDQMAAQLRLAHPAPGHGHQPWTGPETGHRRLRPGLPRD